MKEFRYELHAHTSETSACGVLPARRLVDEYAGLGYQGLLVTDHMCASFAEGYRDWGRCVKDYWAGYRAAKKQGEKRGLDVLAGMELTFAESGSDYLIIGLDEEMLLGMPWPHRLGLKAFYHKYGDRALIVQAHPYRSPGYGVRPQYLHGVEGVNCNPRHRNHNERAMALFHSEPHLLCTCGSDTHQEEDVGGAAVVFPRRLETAGELRAALLRGNYRLECKEFKDLLPDNPAGGREEKRHA